MFCVNCKTHTDTKFMENITSKNGRPMLRGRCSVCDKIKSSFVKGGSILNSVINNLPFEMHLPGHNFTGPGTKLDRRLHQNLIPRDWSKPINAVDEAAYRHDICYAFNKDSETRNRVCDKNMIQELDGIVNPSLRERLDRAVVRKIINAKINFGMGMQRSAKRWTDKLAEELHKPVTRKLKRRRVFVKGIDQIWAADLVDMQAFAKDNNGVKYLLTVIDVFSKYGWIEPLHQKSGQAVAKAFEKIFAEGRRPEKIWVDKGKEFYNKDVKSLGFELYSTENEEKSSVIERWNRTMKEKMFKYFSANSTRKYTDIIDDLVNRYNNTKHSTIKMTPIEASLKKNENKVRRYLYDLEPAHRKQPKFSVGDRVRITKKKKTFEKGYTPRWTEEVFTVSKIQYTDPVTYKISDYNGEEIQGTFYEQELQKTTQNIFRIEKIIRKRGCKSLVKWLGYPDSFNSWIDNKDLIAS